MPTPFDAILTQTRELFCEKLAEATTAMLDKADESLSALADKTQDKDAVGYVLAARDLVGRERANIETEFQERFLDEFGKRVREVRKSLGTAPPDDLAEAPMELELELVGEEDLDETLKFND